MAKYVAVPHPDFFEALFEELDKRPETLPTRDEFLDQVLHHLVETVSLLWDQADYLSGGRGDYRVMRYVHIDGVGYTMTVWRNRVTHVLEIHDVLVREEFPDED